MSQNTEHDWCPFVITDNFTDNSSGCLHVLGGAARQDLLNAQVLLADPGAVVSIIDDAAKLQWMQSTWAGVNALFSDTSKRDYVCTRVAGIFGAAIISSPRQWSHNHTVPRHVCCCALTGPLMAEYVLGYVLLLERKLLLAKSQQEKKVV